MPCLSNGFVPQVKRSTVGQIVRTPTAGLLILLFSTTHAISQTPADELIRQQERERQLRRQMEKSPDVRLPAEESKESILVPRNESPCFPIERIELAGDAVERFQWVLPFADRLENGEPDAALNTCLGVDGVNLVMRRLQNALVARGFVTTRVLAQAQDLTAGVLRLTVIPGRIRDIRFSPDAEGRVSARATRWNALPASPGDILNLRDIEQALENFKRIPTVEADIQIAPAEGDGAALGESDLLIAWKQSAPFRLNLSLDDSGSTTTGRYQGALTLSVDHALTLNDLFYLSLNQSLLTDSDEKGTRGHTAHYAIPFGYWLLGMTSSQSTYHQTVAGQNAPVRYRGSSENNDIKLSRIVYRDARRKIGLFLRGWHRSSNNHIDDEEIVAQRRRMAGWEAGINHKEFIGDATLDSNLNYKRGTGAFNALPAPEELRGGDSTGTARPKILTFDSQLTLPFQLAGQALRYNGSLRAQWNDTPLIPQDRFSIGGRYTVRGFDGELILSAERGWLIRNDLGWALGNSGHEVYFGIDHGEVGGSSAEMLLGKRLSGAVLGLRGAIKTVSYDLFVGTPLAKPEGFTAPDTVAGFNLSWGI